MWGVVLFVVEGVSTVTWSVCAFDFFQLFDYFLDDKLCFLVFVCFVVGVDVQSGEDAIKACLLVFAVC